MNKITFPQICLIKEFGGVVKHYMTKQQAWDYIYYLAGVSDKKMQNTNY